MRRNRALLSAFSVAFVLLLSRAIHAQTTNTCDGCALSSTYTNGLDDEFILVGPDIGWLTGPGTTFLNYGTVQQAADEFLIGGFDESVSFLNESSGIYQFLTNGSIANYYPLEYQNAIFRNQGRLWKSGGTNEAVILIPFENRDGTIEVDSGTLTLAGGGASVNGTFNVASGAVLDLTGGGNPQWSGRLSGSGSGSVLFDSGSITASPNLTLGFTNNLFQWQGGALQGTIYNVGLVTLSGSNAITLTGSNTAFYNEGTVDQSGGANLIMGGFDQDIYFLNTTQGVYQLSFGSSIYGEYPLEYQNAIFTNQGLVWKSGPQTSFVLIPFNNLGGAIEVDDGALILGGGGDSSNGTFTLGPTATLDLTGGSDSFWTGAISGSGAGTVMFSSGTITASPGLALNFSNNTFQWSGGIWQGSISNFGVMTISGANVSTLTGQNTVFMNYGTVQQAGPGGLLIGTYHSNVYFLNQPGAVYDFASDSSIAFGLNAAGQTPSPFINSGLLKKSGGTNISAIDLSFTNEGGSIEVDSGILALSGNLAQGSGSLTAVIGGQETGQWGQLTLTGAAALSGPLNLMLAQGYVPPQGAQFPILSAASVGGTFAALNLPVGFTVNYTPRQVIVTFNGATTYEISASNNPPAGGSVANTGSFVAGTTNFLIATPSPGYAFTNWTEGNSIVGTRPILTNVVTANATFVANYVVSNFFNVSLNASSASVAAPGEITLTAHAAEQGATITQIDFYENLYLIGSVSGALGSLTLQNLAAGVYNFSAVATDNQGVARASTPLEVTVQSNAGVSVINFDALDASMGAVGGAGLSNYLAGFGVGVSNVTLGTRLEADQGSDLARGAAPAPSSPPNLLTQAGLSQPGPVSFTLTLATPVAGFGFTRVGLAPGSAPAWHPAWSAHALDAAGQELLSVSEPALAVVSNALAARVFALAAGAISAVRFDSDPAEAASFAAVLLDDVVLESTAVSNGLGVALTGPASLAGPGSIALTATASEANGAVDHVNFYGGAALLAVASNAPYTAVFSNALPGVYSFTAQVVDTNGYAKMSAPLPVAVGAGPNAVNLDLDLLAAPVSGPALDSYLAGYGVAVSQASPGAQLAVVSQAALYGGGVVLAAPPTNALTQLGSNGPVSFTLVFSHLLTEFSFTRPELLASPVVSHPAWQAQAYDALGAPLGSAQEGLIASGTNVPAATYRLAGSNGLARIAFQSAGNGFSTFNGLLLENLVLTTNAGPLPPAVLLTNPLPGQVYPAPGLIPLAAAAVDGRGVEGVSFYANGARVGATRASPYELAWTNLAPGSFILTAVALDTAGLSWTSPPVNITIVPGSNVLGIARQPAGQTVGLGTNLQFTVAASGADLRYQWYLDNVPDPGQTSNVLAIARAGADDIGNYTVVVSSGGLAVTSQVAALNVLPPPALASQPSAEFVAAGSNVTFSVLARHALSYQWTHNGTPIAGATNAAYAIASAQPLDSGSYYAIAANTVGFVESAAAAIIVTNNVGGPSADDFAGRVAINPLAGPVLGNNANATAEPGEPLHDGKPGGKSIWYTWTAGFSGAISLSTLGSTFDTLLAVYTGTNLAQLAPVAADDDTGGFFTSQVTFNCGAGTNYQIAVDGFRGASGTVVLGLAAGTGYRVFNPAAGDALPVISRPPASQVAPAGSLVSWSVLAESVSPLAYQWYFQNVPIAGANHPKLVLTNAAAAAVGSYAVLVANEAGSLLSLSASLQLVETNSGGPASPSAQDKFGDAVDLAANASGDTLGRRSDNGGDVRGFSLSQTFSTVGATKEEGEPNAAGQTGGASAWYIYTTPAAGTLHLDTGGSDFNTLLAAYTNAGPIVAFSNLLPAAGGYTTNYVTDGQPSLNLPGVPAGQTFYIVVDGYNGASGHAHLQVGLGAPPLITAPPQSRPAVPGETVTLAVLASGTTNFFYQWQFQSANLPGATGPSYSVTNIQAATAGSYAVLVSNVVGAVTSAPALLTLQTAPFLLVPPANTLAAPGQPAALSVTADGLAPLSYQWLFQGRALPGATAPALAFPAVKSANGGAYSVVISNASGSVTSAVAVLTVGTATRPTVAITSPVNPFTTTAASLLVKGTAAGQAGVASVQLSLNGHPLGAAAGSNHWSAVVPLIPGANLLTATSFDARGLASLPATRSILYLVTSPLTLLTSGPGQITGESSGALLRVGQAYTVTATPTPSSGCLFSNWLGGEAPGPLALLSQSPTLHFLMSSNLVLQASFAPNPFTNVAGTYHALFPASYTEVTATNAGALTATLNAARGAYSARLLLGGASYPLTGAFNLTGDATNVLPRPGRSPLTVALHLDLGANSPANPLTGSVSTPAWTSALYGEKAVFNPQANPATAYAGPYTLVIPPGPGGPVGYGAFTLANNLSGLATLAGHLADGAALSQTAPLSAAGRLPLYVPLYAGQGALWGWLNLQTNAAAPPALTGTVSWIRPPGPGLYPGGFTVQTAILGSAYDPALILPPATYTLTLAGGDLAAPLVYSNLAFLDGKFVNPNAPRALTLTLSPAHGALSVTFAPPGSATRLTAQGVLLQDSPTNAAGWFLTPAAAGSFLLQP